MSLKVQSPSGFVTLPKVLPRVKQSSSSYGRWVPGALAFVYSNHYNTRAFGFQRTYRFDTCKFEKITELLENKGINKQAEVHKPKALSEMELMEVHTKTYIERVNRVEDYLSEVVESEFNCLPVFVLRKVFTMSSLYHAAGTVLSMGLALEHGWAINIGGGLHHARFDHGEDVHQGNGVERDKLHFNDQDLFVLDVYNRDIWPKDNFAKQAIDVGVEVESGTVDEEYLDQLRNALEETKRKFRPDMIIFNSGTDILDGDKLGLLRVSPQGVIERDQIIFQFALENSAPIAMVLSGGYTKTSHEVIADSITNLASKFNLNGAAA